MKNLLLLITCVACGIGDMSSKSSDSKGNTCPAAKATKETGACTVEMAEGERLLSDLSLSEFSFLYTKIFKPQITIRIPQVLQKRIDYLNTMVKKPLIWDAHDVISPGSDGMLTTGMIVGNAEDYAAIPKVYADGAGDDDHLPAATPVPSPHNEKILYYPAVYLDEYYVEAEAYAVARITYAAIDYFANPKCPATITGKDGYRDGYFSAKFPNGNEIKIRDTPDHESAMHSRGLSFWVGRDNDLKMLYISSSNATHKLKFATFAECGVRMPEHDYSCVARSTCP